MRSAKRPVLVRRIAKVTWSAWGSPRYSRGTPPTHDILGITVVFTHEWPMAVRLIDLIRGRFPHATIVIGGEHVTSMAEFSLLTSKADIAVLGEGEETVV